VPTVDATLEQHAAIAQAIRLIRGERVMLDHDLASLYGVETRVLVQAVRRNIARFPADFMFQLSVLELETLRSQSVISRSWGGRRYRPYAFTEQGVAMLSSVLRSPRAVAVNVEIMRAFVRLRRVLASHAELARKLEQLEQRYDAQFRTVFDAIRELMRPPVPEHRRIGFRGGARLRPRAQAPRRPLRVPGREGGGARALGRPVLDDVQVREEEHGDGGEPHDASVAGRAWIRRAGDRVTGLPVPSQRGGDGAPDVEAASRTAQVSLAVPAAVAGIEPEGPPPVMSVTGAKLPRGANSTVAPMSASSR
jgi:hypothetical protein